VVEGWQSGSHNGSHVGDQRWSKMDWVVIDGGSSGNQCW